MYRYVAEWLPRVGAAVKTSWFEKTEQFGPPTAPRTAPSLGEKARFLTACAHRVTPGASAQMTSGTWEEPIRLSHTDLRGVVLPTSQAGRQGFESPRPL